ncbi:MAG: hypothetical protein IPL76_10340 [Gemmatimonadetes bacterium]|nr:hypothetical protein [Gemmatimonadota bacterium]
MTLAAGLTGAIYRGAYGPAGVGLRFPPTFAPSVVPVLSELPGVGEAFFAQRPDPTPPTR